MIEKKLLKSLSIAVGSAGVASSSIIVLGDMQFACFSEIIFVIPF